MFKHFLATWHYKCAYYVTYVWVCIVLLAFVGYSLYTIGEGIDALIPEKDRSAQKSAPKRPVQAQDFSPPVPSPEFREASTPSKASALITSAFARWVGYTLSSMFAIYLLSFVLIFADMGRNVRTIARTSSLSAASLSSLTGDGVDRSAGERERPPKRPSLRQEADFQTEPPPVRRQK
jgi:hypothetical protein